MLSAMNTSRPSEKVVPYKGISKLLAIEVRRLESDLATVAEKTIIRHRNVQFQEVLNAASARN